MWGPWFIAATSRRDIASLNKVEMLPWDGWGMSDPDDLTDKLPDDETDQLAAVAARADFDEVRAFYETDRGYGCRTSSRRICVRVPPASNSER